MLNRRREQELWPTASHVDRWLLSYADYMTLLFALFVVLYAFALVNDKQHGLLSDSLGDIFKLKPQEHSLDTNTLVTALDSSSKASSVYPDNVAMNTTPTLPDKITDDQAHAFVDLKMQLEQQLLPVIDKGYAQINSDDKWLTIEFKSGLLFDSASASIREDTKAVLTRVVTILASVNNYIHVRGYTDDQVINNEQFESNWQLSSARAATIVNQLQVLNIAPQRLVIEAYGQYRPKVANIDAIHRAQNRRVVIAVSKLAWHKPISSVASAKGPLSNTADSSTDSDNIQIIELPNGGLRITTRKQE